MPSPGRPMNSRTVRPPDRRRRGGGRADDRMHARPGATYGSLAAARGRHCARDFQRPHPGVRIAAHLSIVELRLVCDEDSDYASETLLFARGRAQGGERGPLRRSTGRFAHPGRTRVLFLGGPDSAPPSAPITCQPAKTYSFTSQRRLVADFLVDPVGSRVGEVGVEAQ